MVGRRAVHRHCPTGRSCSPPAAAAHGARSRPSSTAPAKSCAACSTTGTSRTSAATCRPRSGSSSRRSGFFAMIIPKHYGGLEFSAYAHSCVLAKLASRSATAASTVAVPNSLGPAELLNHYGTEEQKNHYLPRLARGEEIPCFALTGPRAGSDAASIPDTGIVCRGMYQGREVLGLRLNFDKRYITLAPVATVLGLAFRMFDPEQLLGDKADVGITCALIPRNTPGIEIGRRHFPLNIPVPERAHPGQGRVRAARRHHRRPEAGRPGLAHAGRAALGRAAASRCRPTPPAAPRRRSAPPAPTRASAASSTCRSASSRAWRRCIARMVGLTYIMNAARCGHRRRHRRRREARRAVRRSSSTTSPRWAGRSPTTPWTCTAARASCSGPNNYLAAATRRCRWRSRSRARTSSRATSSSSARARSAAIRSC